MLAVVFQVLERIEELSLGFFLVFEVLDVIDKENIYLSVFDFERMLCFVRNRSDELAYKLLRRSVYDIKIWLFLFYFCELNCTLSERTQNYGRLLCLR